MRGAQTLIVFVFLFGAACAPTATVSVMRPAEVDLNTIQQVVVGRLEGNAGARLAGLLTSAFFETRRFDLVDRENLDALLQEKDLSLSGAVDPAAAVRAGRLLGASALIVGRSEVRYDLKQWKSKTYQDKDKSTYRYFHVEATVRADTDLKVVDVATGKVVAAKTIRKQAQAENREKNRHPQRPDRGALVDRALDATVAEFMRMIAPYEVRVRVTFAKAATPEGKAGIRLAQSGDWQGALENFRRAQAANPASPEAWYNLGLAFMYNFDCAEAAAAFSASDRLEPSKRARQQIEACRQLEADRRRLDAQGGLD